jgi:hypothetical protein
VVEKPLTSFPLGGNPSFINMNYERVTNKQLRTVILSIAKNLKKETLHFVQGDNLSGLINIPLVIRFNNIVRKISDKPK